MRREPGASALHPERVLDAVVVEGVVPLVVEAREASDGDPVLGPHLPLPPWTGLVPSQEGVDASEQLGHREGLGHIVVGACLESLEHIGLRAPRRQHQDGHAGVDRPGSFADGESVDPGEHDVEEDEREVPTQCQGEPVGSRGGGDRCVALKDEHIAEPAADGFFVLDNEDGGLVRHA